MSAPASPKPHFVSPPLGSVDMDDLFEQLAKGLDKRNKRDHEKEKKATGRNRYKFTPLFSTDAAAKRKAKKPASTILVATTPARVGGDAPRSVPVDRPIAPQLKLSAYAPGSPPSIASSYRLPKVKPAPAPMKFDPPTFAFGSSQAPASKKRERDGGDQEVSASTGKGPAFPLVAKRGGLSQGLLRHSLYTADSDDSPSSSLLDRVNDVSDTKLAGRKRSPFKFETKSIPSQDASSGCGMSLLPAQTTFGQKKWTKEDVASFVAFADKWIPEPESKKRRVGEKK